jgi:hypothetical protein
MSLRPGGCGFCERCLDRFRTQLDASLASADAHTLREQIRNDTTLFARYQRFHDGEAFRVMNGFIEELRAYAASKRPDFAITANLAYLGTNVRRFGPLWGCIWGPSLDFIMMENDYRAEGGAHHSTLPRGKFTAWYKLGNAVSGAPTWICPSIAVPRQFAGTDHRRYYELMFLEAYANGGRWGYFWWPGVDDETRRRTTAPDALKTYISFIGSHGGLFDGVEPMNDIAVLYLEGPIMRRPTTHDGYVALAQALAESGYQFDVVHCADGRFNDEAIDADALSRYRVVLIPEARHVGAGPRRALEEYARRGGELVVFSDSPFDLALARREDGRMLADFWIHYRDADRARIAATLTEGSSRIRSSDPAVNVIRWARGETQVLHLLNYDYEDETDTVTPAKDVQLTIPWAGDRPMAQLLAPNGDLALDAEITDGFVQVEVPQVDPYAVLVLTPRSS